MRHTTVNISLLELQKQEREARQFFTRTQNEGPPLNEAQWSRMH